MKVLILAAGYGTRLYPLIKDQPKALLPVQGKPIVNYILKAIKDLPELNEVLLVTNNKFDISVTITGGGSTGQAGAFRLGLSRALVKFDEQNHGALKKAEYLTRDSRMKERKKPGQKGARKKFQWVKR